MTASLSIDKLHAGYHGKNILHGVSLELPAGGALTIIGPNGSGKSTLLKAVVGLLPPSEGRLLLAGQDISRLSAPARAQRGMAYVPQEDNVFRNMDVADNLRMSGEFLQSTRAASSLRARTDAMLDLFPELRPHLRTSAGLLSGGQRQMVAMASALMQSPSLLVLDEPSAGLSPRNAELLFVAIRRIRQTGVTLLMIEQNVRLGLSVADTGLVLVAGKVRRLGAADELAADPRLHHLYLGSGQ
ncbi:ABC transporter ATP-binding protein [Variovorax sp. LT1R16]|uniref:ABC transporter ATP-binding protein n=1 Tax=Variovorax sp. LT1R16 TaxID=3443728 RepID=UPI003F4833E5